MSDTPRGVGPANPPAKRPAYEPAARFMRPTGFDPAMRRPITTVAGSVLVLLRVLAGVLVLADVSVNWSALAGQVDDALTDVSLAPEVRTAGLITVLVVGGIVLLADGLLALMTFRGSNLARVIVMLISVVSIATAFAGWWAEGQEVTLKTSLLSHALDILVLLALSSRSAAAYARRNERRDDRR
jgi:hypothetical protein